MKGGGGGGEGRGEGVGGVDGKKRWAKVKTKVSGDRKQHFDFDKVDHLIAILNIII